MGLEDNRQKKQIKRQTRATRKLRRLEYQDMMHSMKSAGLNPILGYGAAPGHSAVSMPQDMTPSYISAASSALSSASGAAQAPSSIASNTASAEEKKSSAALKAGQASNLPYERGNILLQGDNIAENTRNQIAQGDQARTQASLNEAQRVKALKDAGLTDTTNAQRELQNRQLVRDLENNTGGNILTDPVGYVRGSAKAAYGEAKQVAPTAVGVYEDAAERQLQKLEAEAARIRQFNRNR